MFPPALLLLLLLLPSHSFFPSPASPRSLPPLSAAPPLSLPLGLDGNTRLSLPLTPPLCADLAAGVNKLLQSFAAIKASETPLKEPSLELTLPLSPSCSLSLECNPNLFPGAYKAEVFVAVGGEVEVRGVAMLPQVVEAVKAWKKAAGE
ncbi:hypothetical protein TeGR_g7547 [Tetraparma gracilis]|uniref:Uncharacterized protein n=1 Tax=Tetraparma gracilis TaxID=2962635 RepID=A0ABQ6MWM8_9STRA|nr:hypothetical protein TeGR_g7547 [Tetraparma gracilis]